MEEHSGALQSRRSARTCPGGWGSPGPQPAEPPGSRARMLRQTRGPRGGPATCGPHLQRGPWVPRTAARLSRRAPHVPEPGLLHPVLFARLEKRQLRNRGPSSPYPNSPAVVLSHRTPAPPQPTATAAFLAHGCSGEGPSDPAGAFPLASSRGRPRASAGLSGRCSPCPSVLI